MLINSGNLRTLYIAYSAAFKDGLGMAKPTWDKVAMRIPSTTRTQEYGWLGQFPRVREWLGERQVNNLSQYAYAIKNRDFENTIGVDRNDIEDDNIGIYTPLFTEMGRATLSFPDELVWPMLNAGLTTPCYDGQPFFSATHPVLDLNGDTVEVSNIYQDARPTGPWWFVLDTTRVYKPIIFQDRKPFDFVRMDAPTDEEVFNRKVFRYGVDGRCNAGYAFWQIAFASNAPLDAISYRAIREAMLNQKGDYGRPLATRPTMLIVPPLLENPALTLLNTELAVVTDTNGALAAITNVYKNTAQLHVEPWLS